MMAHMQTAAAALTLIGSSAFAQNWCARFTDEFTRRIDEYGAVRLRTFDLDGAGGEEPVLYKLGSDEFHFWNGKAFQRLGSVRYGAYRELTEWTEFDFDASGPERPKIVLAGHFSQATWPDGRLAIETANIMAFDGSGFGRIGNGLPDRVAGLAVCEDQLGSSLYAASDGAIWRWDGSDWVVLWAVDGWVSLLAAFDSDGDGPRPASLYAAGTFAGIAGFPVNHFARWDGTGWTQVVSAQQGTPSLLEIIDLDGDGPDPARLLATFSNGHGSDLYDSLDAYDGEHWTPLLQGGGHITMFSTLAGDAESPDPPRVFASPVYFDFPNQTQSVGQWNGREWVPVGSFPSSVSLTRGLVAFDFDGAGPRPKTLLALGDPDIEWNGERWSPFDTAPNNQVNEIRVLDSDGPGPEKPVLFIGGEFSSIARVFASGFAMYDGTTWTGNQDGRIKDVFSAEYFDSDGPGPQSPSLVVASSTWNNQTVSVWDGAEWHIDAVGPFRTDSGFRTTVRIFRQSAAETGDTSDRFIFYGAFTSAGSVGANRIVSWDGTEFQTFGLGIGSDDPANSVYAVTLFDPDGPGGLSPRIVAAGAFSLAGGAPAANIAQWDGQSWSPLGLGLDTALWHPAARSHVNALQVFDADGTGPVLPALFATGGFSKSGEAVVSAFAKWDGHQWTTAGGGVQGSEGLALSVFDEDGPGPGKPAIVISGLIYHVGQRGERFYGIARWDGDDWCSFHSGYASGIRRLAVFDRDGAGAEQPSLFVSGHFYADSGPAGMVRHLNRWGCDGRMPRVCIGDANQDNQVDMRDVAQALVSWGNTYSPLSCYGEGDANRDGQVAFSDFTAILENFGGHCPSVRGADPR